MSKKGSKYGGYGGLARDFEEFDIPACARCAAPVVLKKVLLISGTDRGVALFLECSNPACRAKRKQIIRFDKPVYIFGREPGEEV